MTKTTSWARPSSITRVIEAIQSFKTRTDASGKHIAPTAYEIALAANLSRPKVNNILRLDPQAIKLVRAGLVARNERGAAPNWSKGIPTVPVSAVTSNSISSSLTVTQNLTNSQVSEEALKQIELYAKAVSKTNWKPARQLALAQEFAKARLLSATAHDDALTAKEFQTRKITNLENKIEKMESDYQDILALAQTFKRNMSSEQIESAITGRNLAVVTG